MKKVMNPEREEATRGLKTLLFSSFILNVLCVLFLFSDKFQNAPLFVQTAFIFGAMSFVWFTIWIAMSLRAR